jgi:catechol 2,3-dioxygenase-like lactoylglutathione lyase family enzyme
MNLNHINLPVPDVNATKEFFAKYFDMKTLFELPRNTLVMMRDEAGMVLNISHFGKKDTEIHYHKDFHIGFFMKTRDEVDAMHARMTADGLTADTPKHHPGRYGYYITAPGGFTTEVAVLDRPEWSS